MVRWTMMIGVALAAGSLGAQEVAAPAGWSHRLDGDQPRAIGRAAAPGEWRFEQMPPGWHITTTERGVVLFPDSITLSGRWGIEVELFLFPNPSDEGLGIALIEPRGLGELRFLMRQDGQATLVAQDRKDGMVLQPWTSDTMATPHDGAGVIKYVLRLVHESGHLAFVINDHEMFAYPVMGGGDEVVIPGLRIGAGLNVHVARFDLVTPLAPARPRGD